MRLLDTDNAKLIQHLWKKGEELEEDIILLKKNDKIWADIMNKMQETAILFMKFLDNQNWQKEFLQCTSDRERQRVLSRGL